jgi:hypothetical protein
MRHINYLLLSFLITVLAIPNYCTAQMQYVIATSTKRIIPIQNVKPIKSLPLDNPTQILTLSRYENGNAIASVFSLSEDNNTNVLSSFLSNVIVEDFIVFADKVFFCGRDLINNQAFFARTDIPSLINGTNNIIEYITNDVQIFSKIDFYINDYNETIINLIDNHNTFVSVNISTLNIQSFRNSEMQLTEIRHTKNFGVILTKIDNGSFGLYAFDKNNISILTSYAFSTPTLYLYNDSTFINTTEYRYLLEVLDENNTNNVVVGFSSTDIYSGTEICNIDLLNDMSIITTQAVISDNETRSFLYDMKYSKDHNGLICLIWNPAIDFTDNIFMMFPYETLPYTTPVTIPEANIQRHLFHHLTSYDNKYYLTVGKDINNYIYLLDKKTLDFSNLNCIKNDEFTIKTFDIVKKQKEIVMSQVFVNLSQNTLVSIPVTTQYSLICQ